MRGQVSFWAASETRNWITVPRVAASSSEKRVSPGTQPSLTAFFQPRPPRLTPTITLIPLSRMFNAWAGPCTPYPRTATVSSFRTCCAFSSGNSCRVTTSSSVPLKLIFAIKIAPLLDMCAAARHTEFCVSAGAALTGCLNVISIPVTVAIGVEQVLAARHGNYAGAHHFNNAPRPQYVDKAFNFILVAGDFNNERGIGHIHNTSSEYIHNLHDVGAVLDAGIHLDHRQVAAYARNGGKVNDLDHVYQLVQVSRQAFYADLISIHRNGHAGYSISFSVPHG